MRHDKNEALKLRLKGTSYSQIQSKLGVSKSTLSTWFVNLQLSENATAKIKKLGAHKAISALIARNKRQTHLAIQRMRSIRRVEKGNVGDLSKRDLFIAGISLYWAEGYKKPKTRNGRTVTYHQVSLTNSDPSLIKLFLRFLRECCGVSNDRIRINLRVFPHQSEKKMINFWMNVTSLERWAFGKTYISKSTSSKTVRPYNQLPYGVIQIRVSDTNLFHRIIGWIEGVKQFS